MRIVLLTVLFVGYFVASAQQPPVPQLSTADKVAIQTFLKQQQDANTQYRDAEQNKLQVMREFGIAHPGFHVYYNQQNQNDPKNYSVESDPKPVPASTPASKPAEPVKTPVPPKK